MDDVEILSATLNNTIQRNSKITQNYEVEIANLTAEIIKLRSQLDALNEELLAKAGNVSKEKKVNASE